MTATEASAVVAAPPAEQPGAGHQRPRWWIDDRLLAVATWLVGLGVAFLVVRVARADPVSVRGATMPIGIGIAVFGVLLATLWFVRSRFAPALLGVIVGAYAAWVALTTKAALYGTPMSFGGMTGDAHRIVAQAAKYATAWGSTDVFQPNTPSDYPPLYTWLTGRASAALGEPAWQLMQNTQVLWLSATVIAVYLLWRRMLPAPLAAVIALLAFVGDANPVKPYEVITLAVMVPWILATFAQPPRGRLHWLPAGVIGGLIVLTYQGFAVFMGLGVLAIIGWTWRAEPDRRAYVLHLVKVAVTALVVSSWYLLPYVWATLTRPSGSFGSDTFQSGTLAGDPLPMHFFEASPIGVLQLIGLGGLVVFLTTTWWARPLAGMLAGTYLFFGLGALRFTLTGHTMFYQYSIGATVAVAAVAGILTVAEALARFADHRHAPPARRVVVLLTVATVAAASLTLWRVWMPTPVINVSDPTVNASAGRPADVAHQEPLPDLDTSRYGPKPPTAGGLPVTLIQADVLGRLGSGRTPMVLSADERLFAYEPWYSYAAAAPTASPALDRWAERQSELTRLAAITDPIQFAQRAAHTAFGPIDVFVLKQVAGSDRLQWNAQTSFSPEQFDSPAFDRVDLPNDFVLFVRLP
jgi:arabinofuranosyltransferase-like protein